MKNLQKKEGRVIRYFPMNFGRTHQQRWTTGWWRTPQDFTVFYKWKPLKAARIIDPMCIFILLSLLNATIEELQRLSLRSGHYQHDGNSHQLNNCILNGCENRTMNRTLQLSLSRWKSYSDIETAIIEETFQKKAWEAFAWWLLYWF